MRRRAESVQMIRSQAELKDTGSCEGQEGISVFLVRQEGRSVFLLGQGTRSVLL